MKKLIQFFGVMMLAGMLGSMLFEPSQVKAGADTVDYRTLGIGITNIAANTTNSTAGTTFQLYHAQRPCRIYCTAQGVAGTTNGSLVVKFSTSYDSNTWDTASASNIKLTMSTLGGATNTVSDWFETGGAAYIREGQIENTFAGAVSNITITIAMPNEN